MLFSLLLQLFLKMQNTKLSHFSRMSPAGAYLKCGILFAVYVLGGDIVSRVNVVKNTRYCILRNFCVYAHGVVAVVQLPSTKKL